MRVDRTVKDGTSCLAATFRTIILLIFNKDDGDDTNDLCINYVAVNLVNENDY